MLFALLVSFSTRQLSQSENALTKKIPYRYIAKYCCAFVNYHIKVRVVSIERGAALLIFSFLVPIFLRPWVLLIDFLSFQHPPICIANAEACAV